MKRSVKTYRGDGFAVEYDVCRCIHAKACVQGLPTVFDPERRPWIDAARAPGDQIAVVTQQCPTGALKLRLADGSLAEAPAETNRVVVDANGPLYVSGSIEVLDADGSEILRDTRIAFCRCGKSENKPLCDNAHDGWFSDPGAVQPKEADPPDPSGGSLQVTVRKNGPLLVAGDVTVASADGTTLRRTGKCALCRCGASANKPFCDGTHKHNGFTA